MVNIYNFTHSVVECPFFYVQQRQLQSSRSWCLDMKRIKNMNEWMIRTTVVCIMKLRQTPQSAKRWTKFFLNTNEVKNVCQLMVLKWITEVIVNRSRCVIRSTSGEREIHDLGQPPPWLPGNSIIIKSITFGLYHDAILFL